MSSFLTLAETKAHLKILTTDDDDVITGLIDAAGSIIEGSVGPVTPQTYTETYNGGGYSIVLRHTPILSVQSIVENWGPTSYTLTSQPVGSSTDAYGYDIEDAAAGRIVRRTVSGFPFSFFPGVGNIRVAYTAGRWNLPGDIRLATLEVVRKLWRSHQSGRAKAADGPYSILDSYILDLLRPHLLMPGIA